MIYISSDLHIGHDREFMYGPRGFGSIQAHDAALVERWNRIVTPDDDVYLLGDLMLGDNRHGMEVLLSLNGNKHIVYGNHDTDARAVMYCKAAIDLCGHATILKYKHRRFYLSHYPTLTAPRMNDYALDHAVLPAPRDSLINLCGHSHTSDRWADISRGWIYHCELDAHEMKPVSLDQIISDITDYTALYPYEVAPKI